MDNLDDVYYQYFLPTYQPVDFIPLKAHGSRLYDKQGNLLIDFSGAVAASALGQTHTELIKTLNHQAHQLWQVGNIFTNYPQLELAKKLIDNTCFDKLFLCNCGSEAVEAALKLARRAAIKTYGAQKNQIVAFDKSFHGRTLFAVSAGGQPKYWQGFEPLPPAINHAPFNIIDGLDELINDNTAAVIVEPIQAEGGVIPANYAFLYKLRELCDKHNAALIFDEVQTGMGRTGSLFAYMQYGIEPDIIAIAKALANGFPIGAMLTKDAFAHGFEFGSHGATFGGNPLSCAVANAAFDLINDKELLAGVHERHQLFVSILKEINAELDVYCDIRGKGLLIGAELNDKYKGKAYQLVHLAVKHGVSVLNASPNVTRFVPALNIPLEDIRLGLARFRDALKEFSVSTIE
jgi:succinylornithine aminotransferase